MPTAEVQASSADTENEVFNRLSASAAGEQTPQETPPAPPAADATPATPTDAAPPPPAGTAPPQEYEIKLRGKSIKVPLNELVALAQMGGDYTIKTQEIARIRREVEADRQRIASEKADIDRLRGQPAKPEAEEETQIDPELEQIIRKKIQEPMDRKYEALVQDLKAIKEDREDAHLRSVVLQVLPKLQEQYPEADPQRVLELTANRVDPDADAEEIVNALTETAREEATLMKRLQQQAVDKAFKNKQNAPAAAGGGAGGTSVPKIGDSREEIEDEVARRLKAAAATR